MEKSVADKHVQKAIAWLATEHSYFKDLLNDLNELKQYIQIAKGKSTVLEIRKVFRDFKYIGKAERRFNNQEKNVEEVLVSLRKKEFAVSGTIDEIDALLKRIHLEAANLIRDSSFYEGKIREYLMHLKRDIKTTQFSQAQAAIMEIETVIEDAEKWIAALSTDLEKAKTIIADHGFRKTLEAYFDPEWNDFRNPETTRRIVGLLKRSTFLKEVRFSAGPNFNLVSAVVDSRYFKEEVTSTVSGFKQGQLVFQQTKRPFTLRMIGDDEIREPSGITILFRAIGLNLGNPFMEYTFRRKGSKPNFKKFLIYFLNRLKTSLKSGGDSNFARLIQEKLGE